MRMATISIALAAATLATSAIGSAALAYDPIVLERGWYRVASDETDGCRGEVGTNGQFYVLSVNGLSPGEPAFLTITNGGMRPIERAVRANSNGTWSEYYIPFRFGHDGDAVSVTLASDSCVVPLEFAWARAKGWDEPAPLRSR